MVPRPLHSAPPYATSLHLVKLGQVRAESAHHLPERAVHADRGMGPVTASFGPFAGVEVEQLEGGCRVRGAAKPALEAGAGPAAAGGDTHGLATPDAPPT